VTGKKKNECEKLDFGDVCIVLMGGGLLLFFVSALLGLTGIYEEEKNIPCGVLGFAILLLGLTAMQIQSGQSWFKGAKNKCVTRAEHPVGFWIVMTPQIIITVLLFALATALFLGKI